MIVMFHLFYRYNIIYGNDAIKILFCFGGIGNSIFLLITSYFLGPSGNEKKFNIREFYLRKLKRLWPSYFVSITFTMIFLSIFELPGRMVGLKDYVLNIVFINGFIGSPYVDGAHWYLTTLISAIIVVGIIKELGMEWNVYVYVFWMLLEGGCKVFHLKIGDYLLGGSYTGLICIGIAIKAIVEERDKKNKFPDFSPNRYWYILLAISAVYYFGRRGTQSFVYLLISLPVFILARNNSLSILENKIFQFLGKISFELYLCHQNIAYAIEYGLTKYFGCYSFAYAVLAMCIVLLFSMAFHYIMDKLNAVLSKVIPSNKLC